MVAVLVWIVGDVVTEKLCTARRDLTKIWASRGGILWCLIGYVVCASTGGRRGMKKPRGRARAQRTRSTAVGRRYARRHESNHSPNTAKPIRIGASACPHDCPSTCALEVEVLDARTIGRVRGAEDNAYTAGVICAKVARYAERVHHPDRVTQPLRADRALKAPGNSRRCLGMTRSISWRRNSSRPSGRMARRRSGRIITPAPWVW